MKSIKPSPDLGTPCSGQSVNWNCRTVRDWPSCNITNQHIFGPKRWLQNLVRYCANTYYANTWINPFLSDLHHCYLYITKQTARQNFTCFLFCWKRPVRGFISASAFWSSEGRARIWARCRRDLRPTHARLRSSFGLALQTAFAFVRNKFIIKWFHECKMVPSVINHDVMSVWNSRRSSPGCFFPTGFLPFSSFSSLFDYLKEPFINTYAYKQRSKTLAVTYINQHLIAILYFDDSHSMPS